MPAPRLIDRKHEMTALRHAAEAAAAGTPQLLKDLVIDRWWASSGEPCGIDVLGLQGNRTALGQRDLIELQRKAARAPRAVDRPVFALWGRAGIQAHLRSDMVLGFDAHDVLT
jgi:hypothetical protein